MLCALLLSLPSEAQAQRGTVIGTVVEAESGDPLPGASVQVEGTSIGASSDVEGRFRLRRVPAGTQTIVVSYIGYEPAEARIDVEAGARSEYDFELTSASVRAEGVTVVAHERGQNAAFNEMRTSASIKNIVSSEQIKQFADPNVADALARVPGVSKFDSRGEASNIFLRGMAPNLNVVTLDGERLPTTGLDDREVSLLGVPSGVVGSIEVNKAITPDMDADAVGGSINLVAHRPVGDQEIFEVEAAGGYHRFTDDPSFRGSVRYGQSSGPLSYTVRASASRNPRVMDDIRHFWGSITDQDELAALGINGTSGVDTFDQLRMGVYEITRSRYSLSGRLDYRLNDDHSLFVRGMGSFFDNTSERHQWRVRPSNGDHVALETELDADGNHVLMGGEVESGRIEPVGRQLKRQQVLSSLTVGGLSNVGTVNLDYAFTFAHGRFNQPYQQYLRWRNSNADIRYDVRDREFAEYEILNADEALDPSNHFLRRWEDRIDDVRDTDINARVHADLAYGLGAAEGEFKFGGRYFRKLKTRDHQVLRYPNIPDFFMTEVGAPSYQRNIVLDRYEIPMVSEWEEGRRFRDANLDVLTSSGALSDFDVSEISDGDDYRATEQVSAGFAMTTLDIGDWMLLGGVRAEHTRNTYEGVQSLLDADDEIVVGTEELSTSGQYLNLFPMAHLRYRLSDRTNVRAAWTNSLARPNFSELAPRVQVEFEEERSVGTIDLGNTDLEPSRTMSFDLMGEHYFRSGGMAAIGLFHKRLNDFIFDAEGIVGQDDIADDRIDVSEFDGFFFFQPRNGSTATLWGLEATLQRDLDFLPGPLDGLGVYGNYTYSYTSADLGDVDRPTVLPRVIPHVLNLGLSYRKGGFQAMLSGNYQSDYLFVVATSETSDHRSHLFPAEDRFIAAQTQIDLAVQQRLGGGITMFGEVNNLTNSAQLRYDGTRDFHYRSSYNYRNMMLGLRYEL